MHQQEILPIVRLTDIEIHITANTDNWSGVYLYLRWLITDTAKMWLIKLNCLIGSY